MSRSPVYGRRIHIAGSISTDPAIASAAEVVDAQKFVSGLVRALMRKGANFVVPVDAGGNNERVFVVNAAVSKVRWL